jgi:hypothetical protein
MCITVSAGPRDGLEPWDADRGVVTIPDAYAADPELALRAVRIVLEGIGVPQPESGARCWCGEDIKVVVPPVP